MDNREDKNIQKLLAAEKKAQEIVGQARAKRAEKMKLAKQEAEKEVAQYRYISPPPLPAFCFLEEPSERESSRRKLRRTAHYPTPPSRS